MAKQMSYADSLTNGQYPLSYWSVVRVELDLANVTAQITVRAWVDADSFTKGKQPIASKVFVLYGADYANVLAALAPTADGTTKVIKDELFDILDQALATAAEPAMFFASATTVA